MATPTFKPIHRYTTTGTIASLTFLGIPADYSDLVLVATGAGTSANVPLPLQFNSITTNVYLYQQLRGTGSTIAASFTAATSSLRGGNLGDSTPSTNVWHIMDYSSTTKHKVVLIQSGTPVGTETEIKITAGKWAQNAAIDTIKINATIPAGVTFSLYGIAG